MLKLLRTIVGGRIARGSVKRSVVWNYVGHLYQIGVNFGLTAYVVRCVSVPEYGLFLFVMSLTATMYLLDIGISNVLVQSYVCVLYDEDHERLNDLLSSAFWFLAILGSIGVLVFSLIAALLPGPFKIPHQYLHEASAILVIAGLVIQFSLPRIALEQIYQACNRYDRINQIQLVTSSVQFVLSVVVLAAGFRIAGLVVVQLGVAALFVLLFILALPASVPGASLRLTRFKWKVLKPVIDLSRWAFFENISVSLFNLFAWSILASFSSMREVAMFGLATKLPTQLRNVVDKGVHVALPIMSERAANNDLEGLRQVFFKTQKLVFGGILPFIVLGCLCARPLIEIWAGRQYAQAAVVMQFLLLAALSDAILFSSANLMYVSREIKKAALITAASNALGLCLIFVTVSRYGAAGVAFAMATTQILFGGVWFTIEACKITHASPLLLFGGMVREVTWPTGLVLLSIACILPFWKAVSPVWLVIASAAIGCAYLVLWYARSVLPLHSRRTEIGN